MSEILGKETIDSFNTSENRGREVSHGLNYQKLGKQLMTEDEIAVMDGGKCILQLRGVRPFFSDKYDITKHPIMICVGIYAVLVGEMVVADNLHSAIFSLAAYTVILCFSLFKSGALAKSIFNAH